MHVSPSESVARGGRDYYIKTSRVLAVSNDFSTSLNMYACMYVFGAFCGAFWKRKINSPK